MFKYFYKLNFKTNTNTKTKKNLIIVFTILFVLFIYSNVYLFYIKDKYIYMKSNLNQYMIQKKTMSIKQTNLDNYNDNIQSINTLKKDYESLNKKIINDSDVTTALVYLSNLMELSNIKENHFEVISKDILKIENLKENEEVLVYKVKISGVGIYKDVVEFTNNITSSNSYYKTREIYIETANSIKNEFVYIDVTIDVHSFKLGLALVNN